jgi:hypothetical protein
MSYKGVDGPRKWTSVWGEGDLVNTVISRSFLRKCTVLDFLKLNIFVSLERILASQYGRILQDLRFSEREL